MDNVYNVCFGGDKNILKLTVEMTVHIYEHTKNHRIIHFKWINYMVNEMYLNKAV